MGISAGHGLCETVATKLRASPRSASSMFHLDYLNTCTPDAFAAALGEIFEHSPWVAQAASAKRPFRDRSRPPCAMMDGGPGGPGRTPARLRAGPPGIGQQGRPRSGSDRRLQGRTGRARARPAVGRGVRAVQPPQRRSTGNDLGFRSSSASGATPGIRSCASSSAVPDRPRTLNSQMPSMRSA